MPLPPGHIRDLDEEPLARGVLEAGLDDTEFHGTYENYLILDP